MHDTNSHHEKTARLFVAALLASTALCAYPTAAQEIVQGGGVEIVDGAGGGTKPDPWVIGDTLIVGDTENGDLEIRNGGRVESTAGFLGNNTGVQGGVLVRDAGSEWESSGQIWVGYEGTGVLSILQGAKVSDSTGNIAYGTQSYGYVQVNGAGSEWANVNTVYVSEGGEGYLDVLGGGKVTINGVSGSMRLANDPGGYGRVNVSGTGSEITGTGDLFVGYGGDGEMFIGSGGKVTMRDATVSETDGSTGDLTVSAGGILDLSGDLTVGDRNGSTGALNITAGGQADAGDIITIGNQNGAYGEALVTGTGALLGGRTLVVGDDGTGVLHIEDAADVEIEARTTVGSGSGSVGTLEIDDGSLTSDFGLWIGERGQGTVTVYSGNIYNSAVTLIGRYAGSSGTLNVLGGVWSTDADVYVGSEGRGAITIAGTADASITDGSSLYIGADYAAGEGTVTVDGGSLLVTGDLRVGSNGGNGTLTIANDGSVGIDGGTLYLSDANNSNGRLVIGAALGDPAAGAGALNANTVAFGPTGEAGIVFNHDTLDYDFDADISGDGDIDVYSGETVYGGTATHTGSTTVHGGALLVNGSIGDVMLIGNGLLGGSGTIGSVMIGANSSLAPGNSVGTINTGPVTFSAGSFYDVELNNGGFAAGVNNDLLNVTGLATIEGGTVRVSPENGTDDGSGYPFGTYTILTASGGVNGEFDGVTDDYAFLSFTLDYDPNNVFLISEQGVFFTDVAQTPNQLATGEAINSLGSGAALYDAFLMLVGDDADARAALDGLSGEIHATTRSMIVEQQSRLRGMANDRIRSAFGDETVTGPAWWGSVYGDLGHISSNGNAGSYDRSAGGIASGLDGDVTDTLRLGLMAAYTASSVDSDDRASSASINSFEVGLYGGAMAAGLQWRFGGSLGWHDIDTTRTPAFSGFSDRLTAGYSAASAQVFGEVSQRFERDGFAFEPYAGLAHVHVSSDSFSETGGDAALSGAIGSMDTTFTTLGIRGDRETVLGGVPAKLSGGLGWRHAFGDITPTSVNSFATGDAFAIAGAAVAEDALLVDLNADFVVGKATDLSLGYAGQVGSGVASHSLTATLSHRF